MPVNLTNLEGVDLLSMSTQGCLTRCRKTVGEDIALSANAISVQVFPFFLDLLSNVPLLRLSAKISATRSLIDQLFSNLPLNIIHHPQRVSFNTSLPIQLDVTSVE